MKYNDWLRKKLVIILCPFIITEMLYFFPVPMIYLKVFLTKKILISRFEFNIVFTDCFRIM